MMYIIYKQYNVISCYVILYVIISKMRYLMSNFDAENEELRPPASFVDASDSIARALGLKSYSVNPKPFFKMATRSV